MLVKLLFCSVVVLFDVLRYCRTNVVSALRVCGFCGVLLLCVCCCNVIIVRLCCCMYMCACCVLDVVSICS